jgi:hypothetical protein
LVVAGKLPAAIGVTPTTRNNIDSLPGAVDPSYIRYNVWQTSSATPVVFDNDEGNSIVDGTATELVDNRLINNLGSGLHLNSALTGIADFKLDGFLKPLAGSPALTGGLSLTFLDPFFVNTTQRGAVITTDPWTSIGSWISTAIN